MSMQPHKKCLLSLRNFLVVARNMQSSSLSSGTGTQNVPVVEHDQTNCIFYIPIDNCKAELFYSKKRGVIHIDHTEVPAELNGRGIGKILAQAAFDYVAENNFKMKIHCDFVQHYLEKYEPDYKKLIA